MDLVTRARELATKAHEGQMYGDSQYMVHPEAVASHFEDEYHKAVALLHDVIEDTPVTFGLLKDQFPPEVAFAVLELTRQKDEPYFDYIDRIVYPLAVDVKLADLEENLKNRPRKTKRSRYLKAQELLGIRKRRMQK